MHYLKIVLLLLAFSLLAHPCTAKLYKYQKDGVWHFTDTPPKDQIEKSEEMVESGRSAPPPSKGGTPLLKDHVARNAIEEAAAATVAIKTAMGYGSGFFISTSGHIITNKHVIRTPAKVAKKVNEYFDKVDTRVEDTEKRFADEKRRLNDYKAKLDNLKQLARDETIPSRKKSYENEYKFRKKEYTEWKARFEKRKKEFDSQRKKYDSGRADYGYRSSVANLAQSFTITLVDDTELYVRLLATSKKHDLALLKLDGYKTPSLQPGSSYGLAQGDPVYAIGNPANLRNTVTSGIFSGFEGKFIQTNAQINPGNSGGPLIDPKGKVLGINTKKKVGRTLEGLGFAIPIQTALKEFNNHLP